MDGGQPKGPQGAPGIGCPDHALAAATTSDAQIVNSKVELKGKGATPVDAFAYPFGTFTNTIQSQVQDAGFKSARTVDLGFNTKLTDPYSLVVEHLDQSKSVATIQSWINTALENKVWLILVFHQIVEPAQAFDRYSETPETLKAVVDYLSQKSVCVLTVSQVLNNNSCGTVSAIASSTIVASAGANGTITPSGTVKVAHNSNQTFTITPALGFHADSLKVDGAPVIATSTYTFSAVTSDHTIAATFALNATSSTATSTSPVATSTPPTATSTTPVATSTPPVATSTPPAPATTPVVSSGGGGGGGGNGPIFGSYGIVGNVFAASTIGTPGVPNTGGVLGVSTFRFNKNLAMRMHDSDVTELQKRLLSQGFLTIATPTNFFGPMTFAAVQKYQAAHNIDQVGAVGPKTRASLNGDEGLTNAQNASVIAELQSQFKALMDRFQELTNASTRT
jgi:hypothetical protein